MESSAGMASSRCGMSGRDYAKFANENVLVVVIIEQKQAIDNIEQIASVPGVDVLFIGVNDLSYSLGVGGKTNDPIVEEAVNKVLDERSAEIKTSLSQLMRRMQHSQLKEPDLRTLTRQLTALVNEKFGFDKEIPRVDEVLVSNCEGFPAPQ